MINRNGRMVEMILYKTNEEKRTVVAYFEGGKEYLAYSLTKMYLNISKSGKLVKLDANKLFIKAYKLITSFSEIKGIAKCHIEDEFNEEEGKKIAKKKLLNNWTYLKNRFLIDIDKMIVKDYENINRNIKKKLIK